jgi:hypothetical protein
VGVRHWARLSTACCSRARSKTTRAPATPNLAHSFFRSTQQQQPASAADAATTTAAVTTPQRPRSINYDADFEAGLRAGAFLKDNPDANLEAIVAAEEAWTADAGPTTTAPATTKNEVTAEAVTLPADVSKRNPNITCLLNCNGETVVSFDALAPSNASAWNASGLAWNGTRGGLAFLARPVWGFARTTSRICFPNVTTSPGDACYPVGPSTSAAGHTAVAAFKGATPTVTLTSNTVLRNYKSVWVSNPGGALSFRGVNAYGQLKCSGTIPASPGAAVDLAAAGCCSVSALTIGYAGNGVYGVGFQIAEVKLCKATL